MTGYTGKFLDPATLADIRVAGGERLLARVAGLFMAEVPKAVARLRQHVAAGQADLAAYEAHALRSNCASMGALGAIAACDMLETSAARADIAAMVMALPEVESQLASALSEVRNLSAS